MYQDLDGIYFSMRIIYFVKEKVFIYFNLIQNGLFRGCSQIGETKKTPPSLPKICCTYHTIMKLGTLIHYLKRIQKIYKSSDTSVEFPDISIFYRKSATFVVSKNTDIDSILTRSFRFF